MMTRYSASFLVLFLYSVIGFGCWAGEKISCDHNDSSNYVLHKLTENLSATDIQAFLKSNEKSMREKFYKVLTDKKSFWDYDREKLGNLLGEYDKEFYLWTLCGLPVRVDPERLIAEEGLLAKGKEGSQLLSKAYLDIFSKNPAKVQISICYPSEWEDPGLWHNKRIMLLLHGEGLLRELSPLYREEFKALIGFRIEKVKSSAMAKAVDLLYQKGIFAMRSGLIDAGVGMDIIPKIRVEVSRVITDTGLIVKRVVDTGANCETIKVADQLIAFLKSEGYLQGYSTKRIVIDDNRPKKNLKSANER